LWAARARREKAEADLAELKLAEQQGQLVRATYVRSSLAKRSAGLRESLLQIPARLAPVLAVETDAARVHDVLQAELHQALAQFVEA
jgi:phage terminase Nu1 subunit (DNA packaging protein)